VGKLSEKPIIGVLKDFGLTEKESEIYIFVAKNGAHKPGDISKSLRMHRTQVYHILKNLQNKGLMESTLEFPMRFTAVPFEKFVDLVAKLKLEEAHSFQNQKSDILAHWRSIAVETPPATLEKFAVIEGGGHVYSRYLQVINDAEKEVLMIVTGANMIQAMALANQGGLKALIIKTIKKRNIHFRILTYVSKENTYAIKQIIEELPAKHIKDILWRHINSADLLYQNLVIRDDEETIFSITPECSQLTDREYKCLWTNSRAVVRSRKALFEEMWCNGIDVVKKIHEIETGKPAEETLVIKDAQAAYEKFREIIDATKKEIIIVTSTIGVVRNWIGAYPVQQWLQKSVKIRIMAPINVDNFGAAQELSGYGQVKHIDVGYMRMAIVDNKHLFQFKAPPLDKETNEPAAYFDHALYSSDPEYVEKMNEMLNDMWDRSLSISEIKSEAVMRSPPVMVSTSDPASKVIGNMLKNDVGCVLVVEDNKLVGLITEKDILDRVTMAQRDSEKTYAKEIMSTSVVTIEADRPLIEALKTMRDKGIRRVAVVKEGSPVGVLTERRALERLAS